MALRKFNAGGKKQKELTEEQQQEIKEARKDIKTDVVFDNQESTEYKKHLTSVHEGLCHKDLLPQRKSSILRVLHKFALCFWAIGCKAPQVEGFVAKIHPKPDAVGKCQQPFRLSAYDQARLELHEDVAEDAWKRPACVDSAVRPGDGPVGNAGALRCGLPPRALAQQGHLARPGSR